MIKTLLLLMPVAASQARNGSLQDAVVTGLGLAFVYGAIHILWNSLVSRADAQASIASEDVLQTKREFYTASYVYVFFWILIGITLGGASISLYIGFTGCKAIAGLLSLFSIIGWLGLWDSKRSRVIFKSDTLIYQSFGSAVKIPLNTINHVYTANGFIAIRIKNQRKGAAIPLLFQDNGIILRKLQDYAKRNT